MSRILCNPCEVISIAPSAALCCQDELRQCHHNKVIQCEDPCFPDDGPQFPGGARVPRLIEGWVHDDDFVLGNPKELSLPTASSISVCSWDERYNLFSYEPSDVSSFNGYDSTRSYVGGNQHFKPAIPRVVYNLLYGTGFSGSPYIPLGGASPQPFNSEPFYILKHTNILRDSISENFKSLKSFLGMRSPTSYKFYKKYFNAFGKSLLLGNINSHHPSKRLGEFRDLAEALYRNKFVPSIYTGPLALSSIASNTQDLTTSVINLDFAREYIRDNRIHMKATEQGRRLNNKLLKQYWHFIPSDIDLRLRIFRDPSVVSPSSITAITVNDDSTVPVHKLNGNVARVHYTEAENLRIWTYDSQHRYQKGCGCCTSGCNVYLCSERDKSYVLDAEDRSVALGLLGNINGYPSSGVDSEPFIELTVSTPSIDEEEFIDRSNPLNISTQGGAGIPLPSYSDFYLLVPNLSGVDTLNSVIDTANPFLKTTELNYKVIATTYNHATFKTEIDKAVRYKSGPGNVLFMDSRDPFIFHLNKAITGTSPVMDVSAKVVDINFNFRVDTYDRYPRRIPAHILIVPTDKKDYNPLNSKSTITRWDRPTSNASVFARTARFVPGPTAHTLEGKAYIKLEDYAEAGDITGELSYPLGMQGTDPKSKKMDFIASDPGTFYDNWIEGSPTSQVGAASLPKQDTIRQVMDFIFNASTYYDTNTNITQNLLGFNIVSHPTHPIIGSKSIPIFDVWRSLDIYDWHEFILKFKNEFWDNLKEQAYFGHQLYNMAFYPEKTYLHKYSVLNIPWVQGIYNGTLDNLRNASGVDFLEANTKMDQALPNRYH